MVRTATYLRPITRTVPFLSLCERTGDPNIVHADMFDQLPNELIRAILCIAISVDRSTAINVAQTSKFVYGIALPIISRRLIVTRHNMKRISVFLKNITACAHVKSSWPWSIR